MAEGYRARLFATYNQTHIAHVDASDAEKLRWFRDYVQRVYLPHLAGHKPAETRLLDIGCNKGYLLAALAEQGYRQLIGVDLSPLDVQIAQTLAPTAEILCVDAFEYLAQHPGQFDAIIIKAVMEHLPKDETLPMLEAIHRALRPRGILLVDVPNMDWLFAQHERYMDFTHEAGFTSESLQQVLSNVFPEVTVTAVDNTPSRGWRGVKKRVARTILGRLLSWADPEGGSLPIWSRSLVGVGKKT